VITYERYDTGETLNKPEFGDGSDHWDIGPDIRDLRHSRKRVYSWADAYNGGLVQCCGISYLYESSIAIKRLDINRDSISRRYLVTTSLSNFPTALALGRKFAVSVSGRAMAASVPSINRVGSTIGHQYITAGRSRFASGRGHPHDITVENGPSVPTAEPDLPSEVDRKLRLLV